MISEIHRIHLRLGYDNIHGSSDIRVGIKQLPQAGARIVRQIPTRNPEEPEFFAILYSKDAINPERAAYHRAEYKRLTGELPEIPE